MNDSVANQPVEQPPSYSDVILAGAEATVVSACLEDKPHTSQVKKIDCELWDAITDQLFSEESSGLKTSSRALLVDGDLTNISLIALQYYLEFVCCSNAWLLIYSLERRNAIVVFSSSIDVSKALERCNSMRCLYPISVTKVFTTQCLIFFCSQNNESHIRRELQRISQNPDLIADLLFVDDFDFPCTLVKFDLPFSGLIELSKTLNESGLLNYPLFRESRFVDQTSYIELSHKNSNTSTGVTAVIWITGCYPEPENNIQKFMKVKKRSGGDLSAKLVNIGIPSQHLVTYKAPELGLGVIRKAAEQKGRLETGEDVKISTDGYLYVALSLSVPCELTATHIVVIAGVSDLVSHEELMYFVSAQAQACVAKIFYSTDDRYAVPLFSTTKTPDLRQLMAGFLNTQPFNKMSVWQVPLYWQLLLQGDDEQAIRQQVNVWKDELDCGDVTTEGPLVHMSQQAAMISALVGDCCSMSGVSSLPHLPILKGVTLTPKAVNWGFVENIHVTPLNQVTYAEVLNTEAEAISNLSNEASLAELPGNMYLEPYEKRRGVYQIDLPLRAADFLRAEGICSKAHKKFKHIRADMNILERGLYSAINVVPLDDFGHNSFWSELLPYLTEKLSCLKGYAWISLEHLGEDAVYQDPLHPLRQCKQQLKDLPVYVDFDEENCGLEIAAKQQSLADAAAQKIAAFFAAKKPGRTLLPSTECAKFESSAYQNQLGNFDGSADVRPRVPLQKQTSSKIGGINKLDFVRHSTSEFDRKVMKPMLFFGTTSPSPRERHLNMAVRAVIFLKYKQTDLSACDRFPQVKVQFDIDLRTAKVILNGASSQLGPCHQFVVGELGKLVGWARLKITPIQEQFVLHNNKHLRDLILKNSLRAFFDCSDQCLNVSAETQSMASNSAKLITNAIKQRNDDKCSEVAINALSVERDSPAIHSKHHAQHISYINLRLAYYLSYRQFPQIFSEQFPAVNLNVTYTDYVGLVALTGDSNQFQACFNFIDSWLQNLKFHTEIQIDTAAVERIEQHSTLRLLKEALKQNNIVAFFEIESTAKLLLISAEEKLMIERASKVLRTHIDKYERPGDSQHKTSTLEHGQHNIANSDLSTFMSSVQTKGTTEINKITIAESYYLRYKSFYDSLREKFPRVDVDLSQRDHECLVILSGRKEDFYSCWKMIGNWLKKLCCHQTIMYQKGAAREINEKRLIGQLKLDLKKNGMVAFFEIEPESGRLFVSTEDKFMLERSVAHIKKYIKTSLDADPIDTVSPAKPFDKCGGDQFKIQVPIRHARHLRNKNIAAKILQQYNVTIDVQFNGLIIFTDGNGSSYLDSEKFVRLFLDSLAETSHSYDQAVLNFVEGPGGKFYRKRFGDMKWDVQFDCGTNSVNVSCMDKQTADCALAFITDSLAVRRFRRDDAADDYFGGQLWILAKESFIKACEEMKPSAPHFIYEDLSYNQVVVVTIKEAQGVLDEIITDAIAAEVEYCTKQLPLSGIEYQYLKKFLGYHLDIRCIPTIKFSPSSSFIKKERLTVSFTGCSQDVDELVGHVTKICKTLREHTEHVQITPTESQSVNELHHQWRQKLTSLPATSLLSFVISSIKLKHCRKLCYKNGTKMAFRLYQGDLSCMKPDGIIVAVSSRCDFAESCAGYSVFMSDKESVSMYNKFAPLRSASKGRLFTTLHLTAERKESVSPRVFCVALDLPDRRTLENALLDVLSRVVHRNCQRIAMNLIGPAECGLTSAVSSELLLDVLKMYFMANPNSTLKELIVCDTSTENVKALQQKVKSTPEGMLLNSAFASGEAVSITLASATEVGWRIQSELLEEIRKQN